MSKSKKQVVQSLKLGKKEKIARSFLSIHDEQQFKWAIRSDKIDCQHATFGFHEDVQKSFVEKIKPILDGYASMKWSEVRQKESCHSFDINKLEKTLQDRTYELFGDNAPETLFQIRAKGAHRIFGYEEEGIFYLLFNDPNHQGYIVNKKHT